MGADGAILWVEQTDCAWQKIDGKTNEKLRKEPLLTKASAYLALTYDHRIVDGREAVLFLHRIKEVIETPSRMLIEV